MSVERPLAAGAAPMTATTYDLYRQLTADRPAKARRYQRSIRDTLDRTDIAATERARLEEALRGLADGLAEHPVCADCGRELSDPESIARAKGRTCHAKAVAS